MWLDLAIAMSCGGAGLVCGWILHAIGGLESHHSKRRESLPAKDANRADDRNREQIAEVAQRIQTYALTMAADVDAHQTKMQAVNNTLSHGHESTHEDVIRAVSDLIDANEEMQTQLKQAQDRIHEQTVQIESAEHRAQTDALTRVPNRRAFDDHIATRVALGPAQAGTLALLDVDHFKKFNDVYGHQAGDEVLRIVANILHSRLHSYGLVARFGGEEFAIILNGIPVEKAKSLVERARIAIGERDMMFENKRLRVSASIGLAQYGQGVQNGQVESIAHWIQQADEALYRSKDAGRDCGHWMDGSTPVQIDIGRRNSNQALQRFEHDTMSLGETASGELISESWSKLSTENQTLAEDQQRNHSVQNSLVDLPDAAVLGSMFETIRQRTKDDVSLVVMAIRCHVNFDPATMRSLQRVARSTMRAVDRIGFADDSTLLICMPSVDDHMAVQRARQICRSAEAVGLKWKGIGSRPVGIGIVLADANETFSTIVSRAKEMADQAVNSFSEPICVAQPA
jgi:diguanylate cyclase